MIKERIKVNLNDRIFFTPNEKTLDALIWENSKARSQTGNNLYIKEVSECYQSLANGQPMSMQIHEFMNLFGGNIGHDGVLDNFNVEIERSK